MVGGEGGPGRRGRSYGPVGAIIWEGQGGHIDEANEASRRSFSARKPPKERSKNGGVSLARRCAGAPPSLSCDNTAGLGAGRGDAADRRASPAGFALS